MFYKMSGSFLGGFCKYTNESTGEHLKMSLIFRNNLNIILCGSIYTSQPVQISTSDCTAELSQQ